MMFQFDPSESADVTRVLPTGGRSPTSRVRCGGSVHARSGAAGLSGPLVTACLDGGVDIAEIPVTQLPDDAVVLDVREPGEWARGHVPNAVHIPLGEVIARLDELPVTDGPLPVICRSGARSAQVVAYLNSRGAAAVNVDGGTIAWAAAGKPLAGGDGHPTVL